jgi:hypothetical protein
VLLDREATLGLVALVCFQCVDKSGDLFGVLRNIGRPIAVRHVALRCDYAGGVERRYLPRVR